MPTNHKSINTSLQAHFGNSNPDLTKDRDSISIWRFQCSECPNNSAYWHRLTRCVSLRFTPSKKKQAGNYE